MLTSNDQLQAPYVDLYRKLDGSTHRSMSEQFLNGCLSKCQESQWSPRDVYPTDILAYSLVQLMSVVIDFGPSCQRWNLVARNLLWTMNAGENRLLVTDDAEFEKFSG